MPLFLRTPPELFCADGAGRICGEAHDVKLHGERVADQQFPVKAFYAQNEFDRFLRGKHPGNRGDGPGNPGLRGLYILFFVFGERALVAGEGCRLRSKTAI